jgi:D-3-phosphoglycerate dehydrogenase
LAESDFISLHIPFDPTVGATIGEGEFAKMKDGVRIVNCARGGVVDEKALVAAMEAGKVAGAALDVFETEPTPEGHAILALDNVSVTPHIGAATVEAQSRVGAEAAQIVIEFAKSDA